MDPNPHFFAAWEGLRGALGGEQSVWVARGGKAAGGCRTPKPAVALALENASRLGVRQPSTALASRGKVRLRRSAGNKIFRFVKDLVLIPIFVLTAHQADTAPLYLESNPGKKSLRPRK
jgi:hypothetical protein